MQCKALFDTGSQKTFVLRDVVSKLKIKTVKNATLSVDGFNSTGIKKDYNVVNLDIHCPTEIVCIEAIVVDNMPSRLHMAGRDDIVNSLTKVGITLADPSKNEDYKLSILIGIDSMFKFLDAPKISDYIYSVPSKLGMLMSGNVDPVETCSVVSVLKVAVYSDESLDNQLKNMWQLDNVGISNLDCADSAVATFEKSVEFDPVICKYIASLPWKNYNKKIAK